MSSSQPKQDHQLKPLDPVSLVQLPQPKAYIPDPDHQSAFTILSSYHHSNRSTLTSLAIINLTQDHPPLRHLIILDHLAYSQALWLDSRTILYLRPSGAREDQPDDTLEPASQAIELWAIEIPKSADDRAQKPYLIGRLPTPIDNLKFQAFPSSSTGILAFSAQVYPPYDSDSFQNDHHLVQSYERAAQGSSGQSYDSIFVRHWDDWLDQNHKQPRLFVLDLDRNDNIWSLSNSNPPRSLFPGLSVPVGPFGSSSDFDLTPSSVVVTAKDPDINPAWHTRQNIYITPLYPRTQSDQKPRQLTTGDQGATSGPVFSPSAKVSERYESGFVAWLEMSQDGYESDRRQVVVYDLETRKRIYLAKNWDRSPTQIVWGKDDTELFLLAEEHGRVKVFYLSLESNLEPIRLTDENSVSSLRYLGDSHTHGVTNLIQDQLLLTVTSLAFGPTPYLLTPNRNSPGSSKSSSLASIVKLDDYSLDHGLDFWFEGAQSKRVHGILVHPPGFVPQQNQKWPLLVLIHGGPQGAWLQAWTNRWHANTFASAGYIVAMINPTGSTGYGQGFTDAITQDWGGKPYKDLVAGYEYLLKTFPEIDSSRTAALGASYGGYMVNWIMGHNEPPLKFKAFVTHDGIFNTLSAYYSTEELYFPEHDLGGTPVNNREGYEKWNPMNFVSNWKTPCLVIHSRKDYRLTESEGLSVFNALQRRGVPSRLLYFPDENHWVTRPPNSIRWYHEIFRFLGEWCPPGNQPTT